MATLKAEENRVAIIARHSAALISSCGGMAQAKYQAAACNIGGGWHQRSVSLLIYLAGISVTSAYVINNVCAGIRIVMAAGVSSVWRQRTVYGA